MSELGDTRVKWLLGLTVTRFMRNGNRWDTVSTKWGIGYSPLGGVYVALGNRHIYLDALFERVQALWE